MEQEKNKNKNKNKSDNGSKKEKKGKREERENKNEKEIIESVENGDTQAKKIAKKILGGSVSSGVWVISFLATMGEATLDVFFNPSLYADLSDKSFFDEFFDENEVKKENFNKNSIKQSIRRLQKQGFVEKKNDCYVLTKKGKGILDYALQRKKVLNKNWDKKYRVVVFDIPEKQRRDRDWLREELYVLQYKQLQKSVFMSKFPLTSDIIKEIKRRKIEDYVDYMLVERIYSIKNGREL